MTSLHRVLNRFNLKTKLTILLSILTLSFVIGVSTLYILSKKTQEATDQFYDTNIMMVTSLNEIKDTYSINVLDTLALLRRDKISHQDGIEILSIAKELILKEWLTHISHSNDNQFYIEKKRYFTKAEKEIKQLDESISLLIEYLHNSTKKDENINIKFNTLRLEIVNITDNINDLLKIERDYAFKLKRDSELRFEYVTQTAFPTIILLFSIIIAFFITISKNIEILNSNLEEKSEDLERLNIEIENTLHLFDSGEFILFKWNNDERWSIDYVSENVYELLGYTKNEFKDSKIIYADLINPEHLPKVFSEVQENSINPEIDTFIHHPYQVKRKDGKYIWIYDSTKIIRNSDGVITHYIGYINNITSYVEQSNKLQEEKEKFFHLANHDVLTNLPNRMMFDDRIIQAIKAAKRNNKQLALLFIDLDHFKEINDSLGHEIGDKVLQHTASKLKSIIRKDDSIARLGGDEFSILLHSISSLDEATTVSQKIIQLLKEAIFIDTHELYITCSIGISLFPNDGDSTSELLKNADAAMYRAKENGRNKFEFYTEDMSLIAHKKVKLETMLRKAIENRELVLFYQPQIDITKDTLTGAEALIRWESPELGFVSPAEFIPIIENSTLIIEVTNFVLQEASRQISRWKKSGLSIPKVSINLAGKDISDKNLITRVTQTLKKNSCNPSWIELEITEGFLMQNTEDTIKKLQIFRDMNMDISIDDFGTGYSSLSYLKELPITKLKIDQSFIKDMQYNESDKSIIKAIIALSDSMNLKVIAEGVETQEQKRFLQDESCNEMQGYLYSKPLSTLEFEKLLINTKEEHS